MNRQYRMLTCQLDKTGDFLYYVMFARGGGVLPYMGYIGMCDPKGYGFSAVLVINWPFWSSLGYGFSRLVFNWVCFLEEAIFSSLSIRPLAKVLHNVCLGQLCQPQRSQIGCQVNILARSQIG